MKRRDFIKLIGIAGIAPLTAGLRAPALQP